jgi:hypothetical protein
LTADTSLVPSLLLVLFVGLKLAGVIAWSWWWVLSPIWLPGAIVLVIVAVYSFWKGYTNG